MGKSRASAQKKRAIVEQYLAGFDGPKGRRLGYHRLSRKLGIHYRTLIEWVKLYRKHGPSAFVARRKTKPLSKRRLWYDPSHLTPREIATIRFGMPGLSNSQVAAYFGRTPSYISLIRAGKKGGVIAAPIVAPKFKSLVEANSWFVHKSIKVLEAWMEMLDKIERDGDETNLEQELEEADHEQGTGGEPQHQARRREPSAGRTTDDQAATSEHGERPQGNGARADQLPYQLREGTTADEGAHATQSGAGGAGAGADGADQPDHLILRRKR